MRRSVFAVAMMAACGIAATSVTAKPEFTASVGVNNARVEVVTEAPDLADRFSGTAARLSFGFAFSDATSFEVGYASFGSASDTLVFPGAVAPCAPICPGPVPNPPPGPPVLIPVSHTGMAYWFAYTPALRHGRFDFTGKFGIARIERDIEMAGCALVFCEKSDQQLLLGAGVTRWISDKAGVGLFAERIGPTATQIGLTMGFRF